MLRGDGLNMSSLEADKLPTSPTASVAHIDNDIGAFDEKLLMDLVQNSCLNDEFPRQELLQSIQAGHRFLVVNCWRNTGAAPIQRAPLGVYATQYASEGDCYPSAKPDFHDSRWYVFPEMTPNECLLFKQYDRDARFPSDLWHCAIHSLSQPYAPLRKSLDLRALIVLKERVPKQWDRYREDRIRPILTLEESGEFCDAQGAARKGK